MYMTTVKYITQISVHHIMPLTHENCYILATLSEKKIVHITITANYPSSLKEAWLQVLKQL